MGARWVEKPSEVKALGGFFVFKGLNKEVGDFR
jgi:hypothetical protein